MDWDAPADNLLEYFSESVMGKTLFPIRIHLLSIGMAWKADHSITLVTVTGTMSNNIEQTTGTAATFKQDLMASVVVFLVALPLCMGIAIASGVPVAAGLITGIIGGIVVGSLAGCPLQVSGPAAGLTVIIYEVVRDLGLEMLGITVLIAGVVQLLAGIFKLGQWFRAVSPAVIQGMLAGIGVLIFASQFHVMVDDKPKGSGWQNLVTIPSAISKGLSWQTLGSSEGRDFQTSALRRVGELHRRQVLVEEHVAEQLPDHVSPELLASETPEQISAEADALAKVVPEQDRITQELKKFLVELETQAEAQPEKKKYQRMLAAGKEAVKLSLIAEQDLQTGKVRHAMQSQHEAAAALTTLNSTTSNHSFAAQIGVLTIVLILLWQGFAPRMLKVLPAPLVAVVLSTAVAAVLTVPVLFVEVPTNLWEEVHFPHWPTLQEAPWGTVIKAALVIAVVASAETLLCATAVDQMQQGPRTKYDKELAAQGIGNMCCGFLGALPMTGVIVRSSANIHAGGKTRLSAILHGIWLLIFVALLASLLRMIPTSSLAAMLVYTGYKLVNPKSIKKLWKYGWSEVVIYLVTVGTIVGADLLTGVLTGLGLAAVILLYRFSHLKTNLIVEGNRAELQLSGAATFLRLPVLASELESVPPKSELHVVFRDLDYIDHACIELLQNWGSQHSAGGGKFIIDWDKLHARLNEVNGNDNGNGTKSLEDANGHSQTDGREPANSKT